MSRGDFDSEQLDYSLWWHDHSEECPCDVVRGAQVQLTCCNGHVTVWELPPGIVADFFSCATCGTLFERARGGRAR